MSKCRECGLLAWRPGCTAGGGDDFNTYVNFDDDSDCRSFRRAKQKPLMDELAEALKAMLTLPYRPLRSSPQQASRIDAIEANAKAAVSRYKQEVGDAEA